MPNGLSSFNSSSQRRTRSGVGFNFRFMRQSGRVSLLGVAGLASVFLIAFMFLNARESLTTVGARFLTALGKHDITTLTKMTYLDTQSPEQIKKQWERCLEYSKYYRFDWSIVTGTEQGKEAGTVTFKVRAPLDDPNSYDQNRQLRFVKVGGEWKVVVREIARDFYPMMPR